MRRCCDLKRQSDVAQVAVVWCGVLWCGVVWCGVVWCGVVWCGSVRCGVHRTTPLGMGRGSNICLSPSVQRCDGLILCRTPRRKSGIRSAAHWAGTPRFSRAQLIRSISFLPLHSVVPEPLIGLMYFLRGTGFRVWEALCRGHWCG